MYINTMFTLDLLTLQSSFTCLAMSCQQFLCTEICYLSYSVTWCLSNINKILWNFMCSWQWVLILQSPRKDVTLHGLVDRYQHFSEILVPTYQTAQHQILGDCNLNKNNKGFLLKPPMKFYFRTSTYDLYSNIFILVDVHKDYGVMSCT
jgi:hypothetical protein